MHIHFLDPYQPRHSPIHSLDARVKLLLIVGLILTTSLMPIGAWTGYFILIAILISTEFISQIRFPYYLQRALFSIPFILAALPLPFITPGNVLAQFHPGNVTLTVSWEGLERLISISLKSWISVQAAIILAVTTSFPDILTAMRAVGVPRILVAVFGLMWRYLFIFADEVVRLIRARAARSSHLEGYREGKTVIWRSRIAGGMAGSLFLRGLERADRVYMAMLARGYDGEVRTLPLPVWKKNNSLILLFGFMLYLLILLISNLILQFG